MYTPILVSAIAVLLHEVPAQTMIRMECTSSDKCPSGSKCVDRICIDCTCDPLSCIRSVETCKNLNCKEDEDCFLNEVTDAEQNSVTVTPKCGKRSACVPDKCQKDENCLPLYCGLQPPAAKCQPNKYVDRCGGVTCPDGYTCILISAYCSGIPCNSDAVCADLSACKDCVVMEKCDVQPKADSGNSKPALYVGKCVANSEGTVVSVPFLEHLYKI